MKKPIINPQIIKRLKKFFAIVQDSDAATRNIDAGKYVIWKNIPCHASAAIVSGDTLAIGTNLTADDDGFVNALNNSLTASIAATGATNYPIGAGQTLTIPLLSNSVYILFSSTNVCRVAGFLGTSGSALMFAEYPVESTGFGISASGLTLSVINNTAYRVSFSLMKLGSTN